MGKHGECGKELLKQKYNGEPKEITKEKVTVSNKDILRQNKKLIGGVDPNFIIEQAKDVVRVRTPEEIAEEKKSISYPERKNINVIKRFEVPGKFFGIKIGKYRIGLWIGDS